MLRRRNGQPTKISRLLHQPRTPRQLERNKNDGHLQKLQNLHDKLPQPLHNRRKLRHQRRKMPKPIQRNQRQIPTMDQPNQPQRTDRLHEMPINLPSQQQSHHTNRKTRRHHRRRNQKNTKRNTQPKTTRNTIQKTQKLLPHTIHRILHHIHKKPQSPTKHRKQHTEPKTPKTIT
jgi:hypothetical protein